jgi:hypothetical protein
MLPPVGNLSRDTQFMHARVFSPNLFGKFKSMVTPRHVIARLEIQHFKALCVFSSFQLAQGLLRRAVFPQS